MPTELRTGSASAQPCQSTEKQLDPGLAAMYAMADFAIQNAPSEASGAKVLVNDEEFAAAESTDLVAAQDNARSDPAFQPTASGTHCNQATLAIAEEMGAPTGPLQGLANQQAAALASSSEYHEVTPGEAQVIANNHGLVIASQANPVGLHGHIATVRPEGILGDAPLTGNSGPLINNIGNSVGIYHASKVFLGSLPVHYYTPNGH